MRIFGIITLLGFIAILLQGTILPIVLPHYLTPQLVVILVTFMACYRGSTAGAFTAFILGLQFDLFCGRNLLGPYAASSVVVFGLVTSFSQRLFLESFFTIFVTVFLSATVNQIVYAIIISQFSRVEALIFEMLKFLPLEALVTALIAWPLFRAMRRRVLREKGRSSSTQLGWSG